MLGCAVMLAIPCLLAAAVVALVFRLPLWTVLAIGTGLWVLASSLLKQKSGRWVRQSAQRVVEETEAFRGASAEVHEVCVLPAHGLNGARRILMDVTVAPARDDLEWSPMRLHLASVGATRDTDLARLQIAEMPLPRPRGQRSKDVRMVEVRPDGSHTGAYAAVTGRRRIHVVVDCPDTMTGKAELRYGGMTLAVVMLPEREKRT